MGDSLITAGILAVVALSEGVRRLPAGALVLERPGFGAWRVARTHELGTGLHLLSWCIPLTLPLVLDGATSNGALPQRRLVARFRARARRVRHDVGVLRVLGVLILVVLVVGVPFEAAAHGAWGFITSLLFLLTLTATQAVLTWVALRRAGHRAGAARAAVDMLWPFAAPSAALLVEEQVIQALPPLLAARALVGDELLLRAIRRDAFDAVHAKRQNGLDAVFGLDALARFLERPPADGIQPWCPRCATVYRPGVTACPECDDLPLRRGLSNTAPED